MDKQNKLFKYLKYFINCWLLLPAGASLALPAATPMAGGGGGGNCAAATSVARAAAGPKMLAGGPPAAAASKPRAALSGLSAGNAYPQAGSVLVVVRGNSQANGAVTMGGASTIGSQTNGAWPDQAAALLGTGYTWQNRSHNGATIDYLRLSDATEVAPLFGTGAYGEEWIVLQETTNQIFQANPAQQVYDKMVAWAQYWKARGVKVAVVTCYPTQDPQYDPEIEAINALYRANWASFADMLLDVASSPYLTPLGMDPQYSYSADGLHLTDVGNQIPAQCVAQGFGNTPRSGIVPATFVLPGIAVPGTPAPTPAPTPTPPAPPSMPAGPAGLRLHYGTTAADYVTDSIGTISQRLDQSGNARNAAVIAGHAGPTRATDNGQQVARFDPASLSQSLTVVGALAADTDASLVVDLRLLANGANSAISIGPEFSIWFRNTSQLQIFSSGFAFVSPLDLSGEPLTRCIFTFKATTREMVLYAHDAEIYRATLPNLPWVGATPVVDMELGGYLSGHNPLSGEIGSVAVYSSLLSAAERTTWFASSPTAPLPVELTAFTAEPEATQAAVSLSWATASEMGSGHFELERSTDGTTYQSLATVAAAGTSTTSRAYYLTDSHLPVATMLYYRLRQVDANGRASYSPVRTVPVPAAVVTGLALFPNPAHTATTIQNAAPGAPVQLLDALGRVVATATADAAGTAKLALPAALATGLYIVRAGSQVSHLVVQ